MVKHQRTNSHYRYHTSRRRHIIDVPRGLLSNIVLRIMKQEPMSGSDIIEEIEKITGWKPSHGSIYPLLDRLSRKEFIKPVESEIPGVKPYALTDKGRDKIEKDKLRMDIRERYRSIRTIYWKIIKEMDENVYEAIMKLFEVLDEIGTVMKEEEGVSKTISSILHKTANKIDKMRGKLAVKGK